MTAAAATVARIITVASRGVAVAARIFAVTAVVVLLAASCAMPNATTETTDTTAPDPVPAEGVPAQEEDDLGPVDDALLPAPGPAGVDLAVCLDLSDSFPRADQLAVLEWTATQAAFYPAAGRGPLRVVVRPLGVDSFQQRDVLFPPLEIPGVPMAPAPARDEGAPTGPLSAPATTVASAAADWQREVFAPVDRAAQAAAQALLDDARARLDTLPVEHQTDITGCVQRAALDAYPDRHLVVVVGSDGDAYTAATGHTLDASQWELPEGAALVLIGYRCPSRTDGTDTPAACQARREFWAANADHVVAAGHALRQLFPTRPEGGH